MKTVRLWTTGVAGLCVLTALLSPVSAADEKLVELKLTKGSIKLQVPESWEAQPSSSNLRVAQCKLPAAKGDAEGPEFVVFYFGKNGGGGVADNIKRWKGQFESEELKMKVVDGTSKLGKYTLVDLTGTWNKPVGPPIAMQTKKTPGSRALQMILHTEADGDYFLRLAGSEKSVAAQAEALRTAIGADPKSEKDHEI